MQLKRQTGNDYFMNQSLLPSCKVSLLRRIDKFFFRFDIRRHFHQFHLSAAHHKVHDEKVNQSANQISVPMVLCPAAMKISINLNECDESLKLTLADLNVPRRNATRYDSSKALGIRVAK